MIIQFLLNGLIAGSTYALVALGFSIIYSTVRFFHFAHGAVFTVGAYLIFSIYILLGWPLWVACSSIVLTAFLGVTINITIYKPLKVRNASSLILLIASLGVFMIIQNLISLIFGEDTKTIRSGIVQEGFNFFGARITPIQIVIILTSITLFFLVSLTLYRTKIGRALRAVANDPELARIYGIPSDLVINFAFMVGSGLAAIAAFLISLDVDITPMMGFNALLMGIIAVIIGGMGHISGAYFGGILLGLAQNLGIWQISSKWQDAIAFAFLIIFIFFRPQGIWGRHKGKMAIK